ncbi:purine-nucleoside phosphorylase, partial [Neobacillus drentensis]
MSNNTEQKETPHIKPNGVEIAETILLPGDPLRAKFIAE